MLDLYSKLIPALGYSVQMLSNRSNPSLLSPIAKRAFANMVETFPYKHKTMSKVFVRANQTENDLDQAENEIDGLYGIKGIEKNRKRHEHFQKKWKRRVVLENNRRRQRDIVNIRETIEWIEYRRRNKVPDTTLVANDSKELF